MSRAGAVFGAAHFLAAIVVVWSSALLAEGSGAPAAPWREVSVGGEVTRQGWSAYSTLTAAPFGDLDSDGVRFRSTGGYGRYRYDGTRRMRGSDVATTFHGANSFSDIMLGYQVRTGLLTVKGFAGAAMSTHSVSPFDSGNAVVGMDYGFKGALETWAELRPLVGAPIWASVDLSWTAAHETYAARVRTGYRIDPELSAGLEAGAHGNAAYDGGRAGLFLRYSAHWGEVSVSGGLTGDIADPKHPYATLNWLLRY